MTLQELALISDVVAAIAIIVTLVYLTVQIRDGARAARSAAVTDATTALQAWYQVLGSSPETSKLFLDGMTKPESLSEQQQFQLLDAAAWPILRVPKEFLSRAGRHLESWTPRLYRHGAYRR
jgi:hypothetical protein